MRVVVKKEHPTILVTVRSPVDVLIAPLVKALLLFPEVATLYSCQGTRTPTMAEMLRPKKGERFPGWDRERDSAWVRFTVGDGSGQAIAAFIDKLLATLYDGTVPNKSMPRADWAVTYTSSVTQGRVTLEQHEIPKMVKQLKRVHRILHPRGVKGV